MSHSHLHDRAAMARVHVARLPKLILLSALGVAAVITVIGLLVLWPHGDAVKSSVTNTPFAVEGATFPTAEILSVTPGCDRGTDSSGRPAPGPACSQATVKILTGAQAGKSDTVTLNGPYAVAGLGPGDKIELMHTPAVIDTDPDTGQKVTQAEAQNSVFGVVRTLPLALWTIAFIVVVGVIGRRRGLLALVALGFAGVMVVAFILPALLAGGAGLAIALVGSSAIMFVVLYLAHGPSVRTSTALAGTLAGVVITAALAVAAAGTTRLSGMDSEEANFLAAMTPNLNFNGLLICAIIIAGLGVLNDVTITQTSSVWELRAAAPGLSRREIFGRAMRIGRDHIASTIYTIVFAYAGASLSVLLLLYIYNRPILSLLSYEDIATEIIRTLCSGIGLVLAVPITTAIAAVMVPPQLSPEPGTRRAARMQPVTAEPDAAAKPDAAAQ